MTRPLRHLRLIAGSEAAAHVRAQGLRPEDVAVLLAAAGGTKFLLLGALDRVLSEALRGAAREGPVDGLGSSIGSFRLAALASRDPDAALERLATAYVEEERYTSPGLAIGTKHFDHVAEDLVRALVGDEASEHIVGSRWLRLHVLACRCRGLLGSDRRVPLLAGIGILAARNALLGRSSPGRSIERVIFHAGGARGPFGDLADVPTRHATLDGANLGRVLRASSAIPLILRGVALEGDTAALYRDAALLDHHPLLDVRVPPGQLVLYPHFYAHLRPGFFDPPTDLGSRRARTLLARTLVIAPTERFLALLPGGRRPSRRDASRFTLAERRRRWWTVWRAGEALAEDFVNALVHRDRAVEAMEVR